MAPDRNARLAHSMRSSSYVFCNAALVALKHRSLLIRFWISGGASMAAPKVQQGALRSVVTDHLTPEGPNTNSNKKRKLSKAPGGREAALRRRDDDAEWVGPEIDPGIVSSQWPDRPRVLWDEDAFKRGAERFSSRRNAGESIAYSGVPAVAHFKAIELEEDDGSMLRISLGDYVEINLSVNPSEEHFGVMEVKELFEDSEGGRFLDGHWFYKLVDTALAVNGEDLWKGISPRRIFRASDYDNQKGYTTTYPFAAVDKKVTVRHIRPGSMEPRDVDYWWYQEHDRRFFTFMDKYPEGSARQLLDTPPNQPRVLKCADFYAGCGGLSFVDKQTSKVHITTAWAVDFCESMTLSFRANYPETHVFKTGVDEWLQLCKMFAPLVHNCLDGKPVLSGPAARSAIVPNAAEHAASLKTKQKATKSGNKTKATKSGDNAKAAEEASKAKATRDAAKAKGAQPKTKSAQAATKAKAAQAAARSKASIEAVEAMQLGDFAARGKSGQILGCLMEPLTSKNCWLEVKVKRQGFEAEWEKLGEAEVPEDILAAFVKQTHASQAIPVPGDIDVVMGGPPCQGVSGLNRHGASEKILQDGRNRQVTAFYDVVEFFQPAFVLMENVVDTLKKEDGTYAKSAMASLLAMRYQVRTGIIAACDHGVPQSRNRVFMWGAKSGQEQLPPFPQPTHRGIRNSVPTQHKETCVVDFPNEAAREAALDMVTMGDILSDLPPVTNFTFAERAQYASKPQTPSQLWLQRDPPSWQATRESRAERADTFLLPTHQIVESRISSTDMEKVGKKFWCNSNDRGHAFAVKKHVEACHSKEEWEGLQAEMAAAQKAQHYHTGVEVMEQFQAAREAKGPVRDQRPLCLNLDDHTRVCSIPKAKRANFRQLPGVVTHPDGTCCVGHWHAAITHDKSSCSAGGHWNKPKKSNQKQSRVDNEKDVHACPGTHLEGCPATTTFMASGGLLCPRWCITYKDGKSSGRHGCFGRVWYDEVQPTVVGRAEPHNLALIHPEQDRVLTMRENARTQGFPDYFALVGLGKKTSQTWVRNKSLVDRYQQMGNAVCPMVASALGRCLALAAVGEAPLSLEQAVVPVPDPEFDQCMAEAEQLGLQCYFQSSGGVSAATVMAGGDTVDAAGDEEEENLVSSEDEDRHGRRPAGDKHGGDVTAVDDEEEDDIDEAEVEDDE